MPRYQIFGGELLKNRNFEDGLTKWKVVVYGGGGGDVKVTGGTATIVNKDTRSSTVLTQFLPLPPAKGDILIQADIRVLGVIGGPLSYQRARIYLVGHDRNGKYMWRKRHSVTLIEGTKTWKSYSAAIPVADGAAGLILGVGMTRASGVMEVRNLSLFSAFERPSFRILSFALLALLGGVLVWVLIPVFRSMTASPARAASGTIGVLILIAIGMPGSFKRQIFDTFSLVGRATAALSTWLAGKFAAFGLGLYPGLQLPPSKIGHFLFFALIAGVSRVAWPYARGGALAVYFLIFAATTETLQFYAVDRTPSLWDVAIDAAGILTGFACVFLAGIIRGAIRRKAGNF
jgi:putative Mn2+ efflux pump MntP